LRPANSADWSGIPQGLKALNKGSFVPYKSITAMLGWITASGALWPFGFGIALTLSSTMA